MNLFWTFYASLYLINTQKSHKRALRFRVLFIPNLCWILNCTPNIFYNQVGNFYTVSCKQRREGCEVVSLILFSDTYPLFLVQPRYDRLMMGSIENYWETYTTSALSDQQKIYVKCLYHVIWKWFTLLVKVMAKFYCFLRMLFSFLCLTVVVTDIVSQPFFFFF